MDYLEFQKTCSSPCQNVMRVQELSKLSVMDLDPGADPDLGHEAEMEACRGAPKETEREEEGLLTVNDGDGNFSSASSSNSSLRSSSTLPPSSSSPPACVEEEKETLSGCSKSFTGLKLFTRK